METDMAALAVLVRRDRAYLRLSQVAYGRLLGGLSQAQVSDLERGTRLRSLSPQMTRFLRRRFTRLPSATVRVPEEVAALVERVTTHAKRQLSALTHLPQSQREEIGDHLIRQITLITEPLIRASGRRKKRGPPGDGDLLFTGTSLVATDQK
jgi:hypothetical protein